MTELPIRSYGVSVFVLRGEIEKAEVLLLRRTGFLAGTWCQIAGSIEPGEKAWQTAVREVFEETGIEIGELWSADVCEQFYEADKECITLVPVFVTRVPQNTEVVLNDEHDAFRWVDFEEAAAMLSLPGQRRVLSAVKTVFVDQAPHPHLRIDIGSFAGSR